MRLGYTELDIISKCQDALLNINTFYQAKFINYRGKTNDTKKDYSEVIVDFILDNINLFRNNISVISREKTYNSRHDGSYREGTGRDEEVIAIKMFNQSQKEGYVFDTIGKVIDYQTPLKNRKDDVAGKIDLLAYNGEVLRILELKKPSSDETMLRCILEGYTYLKTVDQEKLLKSFDLPLDTIIKASPLVFYQGEQWKEWQQRNPKLLRLMEELESEPFFVIEENGKYMVLKEG